MEIILQIDEPYLAELEPERIETAVRQTLLRYRPEAGTVTVAITGTAEVQALNRDHRGLDAPTDVLSFENMPDPDFPANEADYLGDVIIAYPVAQQQAQVGGHAAVDEVILLAIHGTLHLAGFDHDTPANKAAMWAAQEKLLAGLGLAHVKPTEA